MFLRPNDGNKLVNYFFTELRHEDVLNYFLYGKNPVTGGKTGCRRLLKKARKFVQERDFFGPVMLHSISPNSEFCYVKASMRASMIRIAREVHVVLVKDTGAIYSASCACKAGLSGYCSHTGALLLKLVALKACTSRLCEWTVPSNLTKHFEPQVISDIAFGDPEKIESAPRHAYVGVYQASSCQDPEQFLADLLSGLALVNPGCVLYKTVGCSHDSIKLFTALFEPEFCLHDKVDVHMYQQEFEHFVDELKVHGTQELVDVVAASTKGQGCNPNWKAAREVILTASNFGSVVKRKESTLPDKLVSTLCGYTSVPSTKPIVYGHRKEGVARRQYVKEHAATCKGTVEVDGNMGLKISLEYPYLGASLDGLVKCSKCGTGALEVKCPYKWRKLHPEKISDPRFCSKQVDGKLKLDRTHNYFYQVMGQLGVCGLDWADFYIWTKSGTSVERIVYDHRLFMDYMVPRLTAFYTRNIVAELFTTRVKRGLPLY